MWTNWSRKAENSKNQSAPDRKSTRLNSSHLVISYAVFCLKKKKTDYSCCCPQNDIILTLILFLDSLEDPLLGPYDLDSPDCHHALYATVRAALSALLLTVS